MIKKIILSLIFFSVLGCSDDSNGITETNVDNENTIVKKYGQLSVSGKNITDQNGHIVVLRGMSLFWSQWKDDYYTEETIKWLRDDWKCTVIRAAMGVEPDGYLDNPETEYQKITSVIDACIKLGIYVQVDWHDHNGEDHLEEAKIFYNRISSTYGNTPNIIYEIYNEPLNVSWNNVLKPHSEEIISTIRNNDSNNLIIVGTPNWSQDVDDVIGNRINDDNVVYSLHFYTGTHRESLRDKASRAIAANIPIFVSEWGISEATGNGNIDIIETNLWSSFMEVNNLSWCNWSVTNKDETSAILLPSTNTLSGWSQIELSEAGKIIRDYLIRMNCEMFDSIDIN